MAFPTRGEVSIEINAPPAKVYELVSDMTRMGEWSPECYRVEWIGDSRGPAVGAEFEGHNHMGPYRWSLRGKVVSSDPDREFAFTTFQDGREGTRWRYRFEPLDRGTRVVESYEFMWTRWYIRLGDLFMPRRTMLQRGMRKTLERIKKVAETT